VQIGHNCRIGAHTAMAGCSGIAGSTSVGRRCMVGAGARILGHLQICDDVQVSAGTVISRTIAKPGAYTGLLPAEEHRSWARNAVALRHLAGLVKRVRALENPLKREEKTDG
jgi:UDP-3-O-[3-hydroxymyristoyl] glucosamine N-acyltransferase